VKHTKLVTLNEARDRKGITQLQLEEASGVDRTRISKLETQADPNPTLDTYEKLDKALRALGALKASEKLVFGPSREAVA